MPVKAKRTKSAEKARCQAYLPLLTDGTVDIYPYRVYNTPTGYRRRLNNA